MSIAIITGSAGLIGSEATQFLCDKGYDVVGIDNDMRGKFFGEDASTTWHRKELEELKRYSHANIDIRNEAAIHDVFKHFGRDTSLIIHAAAQPSHDWAADNPVENFDINTKATLTLLEAARHNCSDALFIFLSSNKVYGDLVNRWHLQELPTRYDVTDHPGVNEAMSIDGSMHSLYGASKAVADLMVQEYGRYYKMKTVCFRCGCLTGPAHAGTQMHGFLSYLMKCAITGKHYDVIGYGGKQVRDHIHASDVIDAFWELMRDPQNLNGEIYNLGGGRGNECSIVEAIKACEELTGRPMNWDHVDKPRRGDHKWWVTNNGKFKHDYPDWKIRYGLGDMLMEMYDVLSKRISRTKQYA